MSEINRPIMQAVTYPAIPTATWTKVSGLGSPAIKPSQRMILWMQNQHATASVYIQFSNVAPTTANQGILVKAGEGYNWDLTSQPNNDVWMYQTTGSEMTTFFVQEGF